MSAKDQAILDIKEELKRDGRCFIAFRSELNPVMRKLVRQQINAQDPFKIRHKSQLVAHCFFSCGSVQFNNYSKYYGKI